MGRCGRGARQPARALGIRPQDVGALVDAANCLKELGQAADAITVYQEALRLESRQPTS